MFLKRSLIAAILFMGIIFAVFIFIDLSSDVALAQEGEFPNNCGNNDEFTQDFLIDNCQFKARGYNPYFILLPGFQFVLEDEDGEEREVVTVLRKTKKINLDGRKINTRVVEERALEWEEGEGGEEGDWKTVEISLNWFAICDKTNDVYYFGEWSRDCEDGFDENDECEGDESNEGSWEAGKPPGDDPTGFIARPGIIMPGTFLLGAKYFQEVAPPAAVDRGEHVKMGIEFIGDIGSWKNCVQINDTNPTPTAVDACGDGDAKIYCPELELYRIKSLNWSTMVLSVEKESCLGRN